MFVRYDQGADAGDAFNNFARRLLVQSADSSVCSILFRYVPIRCIRARDRADRGVAGKRNF